jgi:beta-1,4-N-acetylglucosaminyltransferase
MAKTKVIIIVFGEGGHKREIQLFLDSLPKAHPLFFVSIGPSRISHPVVEHCNSGDVRDKHSRIKSAIKAFIGLIRLAMLTIRLCLKYDVQGAISTGPGVALVPFALLKLSGKKTVFIETFCRFHTRSFTGRVMYLIADRFFVQNKELLTLYPDAEYSGRL